MRTLYTMLLAMPLAAAGAYGASAGSLSTGLKESAPLPGVVLVGGRHGHHHGHHGGGGHYGYFGSGYGPRLFIGNRYGAYGYGYGSPYYYDDGYYASRRYRDDYDDDDYGHYYDDDYED